MNTAEARDAYPETVIGGVIRSPDPNIDWTVIGKRPRCNFGICQRVLLPSGPPDYSYNGIALSFHPAQHGAWTAFGAVMRFFGETFHDSAGGSISCRALTGHKQTSLHAHASALDLNPEDNPFGTHKNKYADGFVDAVLAIKTVGGFPVFRWGDEFEDPMHWEPTACTRQQLVAGIDWNTVEVDMPQFTDDEVTFLKEQVAEFQALEPEAKPRSPVYNLQFYRRIAERAGISGADPIAVADALWNK